MFNFAEGDFGIDVDGDMGEPTDGVEEGESIPIGRFL